MTNSIRSLMVKRCCPPGNKYGCQLWTVQNRDGYSLGKFGTRTGALNFAHGRVNDRQLQALRSAVRPGQGNDEITIESVIEVEQD